MISMAEKLVHIMLKKYTVVVVFVSVFLSLLFTGMVYMFFLLKNLPQLATLKDYAPPLTSVVLDRQGRQVGEFFKERRVLTEYERFPEGLKQAFVAAEDGSFFEHGGLNVKAIFRALLVNIREGRKVQGGSTITQQVARSLMLSSEKTYTRKLREAVLAVRMESRLSKEEILYLYLNQIYLGQGAYGVGMAARAYFEKSVEELTLPECALLAGLTQAPSRFSPLHNPKRAKERQVYVLGRMQEEGYITREQAHQATQQPLKIYRRKKTHQKAPYYLETLRQLLVQQLGEDVFEKGGLEIHTAMDFDFQQAARRHLRKGLKELDKRRGFRGPVKNLSTEEEVQAFLKRSSERFKKPGERFYILSALGLREEQDPSPPGGKDQKEGGKIFVPPLGAGFEALVSGVFEEGVKLQLSQGGLEGFVPVESMDWALKPKPGEGTLPQKPSQILKTGDVVEVQVLKKLSLEEDLTHPSPLLREELSSVSFLLALDQEPEVEGAVLALDQKTGDIVALVGGYDFNRSQFNRVYQALRSTGSVFKPVVYTAALDGGFTPASVITDSPLVYSEDEAGERKPSLAKKEGGQALLSSADQGADLKPSVASEEGDEGEQSQKKWKPGNYGRHFSGDILLRNALIRSINIPTVKLIENLSIDWVLDYARRLGIFSPLNPDYTLALGSSSVTLYEMTKVFSVLGRGGKNIKPLLLHRVEQSVGGREESAELLSSLSLDVHFQDQIQPLKEQMHSRWEQFLSEPVLPFDEVPAKKPELPPFFFKDEGQLISEKTAFLITTLLRAAIEEPGGTGYGARDLKWPVAGKTGTTNNYYDAWFIGYSPRLVFGVWVGFDNEQSLGRGETGARAALPIWKGFMEETHKDQEPEDFKVPAGIVFTRMDNETGSLVTPTSQKVVVQAFVEGTQPRPEEEEEITTLQDQDFLREGL